MLGSLLVCTALLYKFEPQGRIGFPLSSACHANHERDDRVLKLPKDRADAATQNGSLAIFSVNWMNLQEFIRCD